MNSSLAEMRKLAGDVTTQLYKAFGWPRVESLCNQFNLKTLENLSATIPELKNTVALKKQQQS
jgi:hypothetical protein